MQKLLQILKWIGIVILIGNALFIVLAITRAFILKSKDDKK